jgi:hypothetical protein
VHESYDVSVSGFFWICHVPIYHGIFKLLRSPGIYLKESIPSNYVVSPGILEQSMGARKRVGIGLSYRPARLHRLAGRYVKSVPIAAIDCYKIPALAGRYDNPISTRFL